MRIARCLSALAISAVLVSQFGLSVSAARWQKTGFGDMPAYNVGIIKEDDFSLRDARISSTNPALKYSPSKETMFSYGGTNLAPVLYYQGQVAPGQTVSVAGSITALWPNRAIAEDGDLCDVELTISNIKIKNNSTETVTNPNIAANSGDEYKLLALRASPLLDSASYNATIRILEHGTNKAVEGKMLMAFFDLDIPNFDGDFSADASNSEPAPYAEQVGIIDGLASDIYTTSDTLLRVNASGTKIWGSEGIGDDTSPLGQTMFVVDSAKFTFNWQGTGCGTLVFSTPEKFTITSRAYTGGTITPTQEVFWKGNRAFRTHANEGYYIKSITVDGREITLGDNRKNHTYRFTGVTDNHNIVARFGRLPSLTLNKTTTAETVKIGDTIEYAITVTNPDSEEDAIAYTITDVLGEGLSYVSDDAGGTINGQIITWRKNISAGRSLTIRVKAIVTDDAEEKVINTAFVTDPDGNEITRKVVENPLKPEEKYVAVVENPHTNDYLPGLVGAAFVTFTAATLGLRALSRRRA